ncbi:MULTISPECIES: ubiquinol-cytochrome c reductase iron-sulfur subunit [unclassified Leptolyngbya]|uniref:QcrA and Rieske domain-containing protein n=1 Tax=unclassified Leptolyngbya TaxID=2650499 RepID=UPI0016899B74|nr:MULTISPECIES: ubiquinol-cytochrome c reductase iron-sulfur subunit [unclassified Leptolyngbya]MBD1911061.1 ubiquinol-cytochrome c reductase iron-sulfur subunit [Leptolyngbya sp. FACHB-8]MBD2158273.1 ubiquinol-cytochrome c reductase iron-sulfur subunit [Leptolyngbya sp. FACHB-16]
MNRREFLGWIGVGTLASSLPVAIVACTPSGKSDISGPLTVGTLGDLDQKGQLVTGEGAGKVLVIRDPAKSDQLLAVNPICTHKGCDVEWKADQTAFVCPCHGAKFGADGTVQAGPARESLPTFTVKVDGSNIVVEG